MATRLSGLEASNPVLRGLAGRHGRKYLLAGAQVIAGEMDILISIQGLPGALELITPLPGFSRECAMASLSQVLILTTAKAF